MSWIQKLYETYEQCAGALPPVSHTTQQAHIEIVIDESGNFRRAREVQKEESTTLIPCTEESGGRAGSKPVNHPLCDKLQYVAGDFLDFGGEVTSGFAKDPNEPHRAYLADLSAWANSAHGNPKLNAILAYVRKGQVTRDLIENKLLPDDGNGMLLKEWVGGKSDTPPIFKIIANPEGAFIRWKVETPSDPCSATWDDRDLMNAWIAYYASRQTKQGLCMVTGDYTTLAVQHPAKLRNAGDKAKLISSNDTSGYTFRGRFLEADEVCGVGFEVTQKAHNALRWLIDPKRKQAFRNGEQVVVSWAVSGKKLPDPFANSFDLFGIESPPNQLVIEHQGDAGQAFGNKLSKLLAGYRTELGSTADVVVMGLDSATPGRMAITFYRELTGSEFLDRVRAWHESCAWHQNYSKDMKFIGAPSPRDIAEAAFGRRLDDKLRKATVERLLPCIIDGRLLPRDLVNSAVSRTCNRMGLDHWEWEKNLGIACALFKSSQKEKETYQMTLETDRTSRDYLYGRLLAIAEHIEGRALYVGGEMRDTTAAKLMQRFADRPASTWRIIEPQLMPYMSRLHAKRPAFLYEMKKLLDEVIPSFKDNEFLDDGKLSGEFLLGYHRQRQALNPPKVDVVASDEETTTV